ncbi:MAG: ABC transporter permease subunit [Proteobacteria bacterium]|nr:ABC transporter permease subunit [Pseudomonadota bacterium]
MIAFIALYREAFIWLRRDKIFGPILMAGVVISLFANIASNWTIEEFSRILFDVGIAGFRITGGLIAILWGSRMIHDAIAERSLDPRLASPISRNTWYLARYCALATVLFIMGLAYFLAWQVIMHLNGQGLTSHIQNWAFGMLFFEWLILAALSMLLATLSGFGMSLFSTTALWIIGIFAPLVAASKDIQLDPLQAVVINLFSSIWNFHRFNILDDLAISGQNILQYDDLVSRLLWIISLLATLLVAGTWRFTERDLN